MAAPRMIVPESVGGTGGIRARFAPPPQVDAGAAAPGLLKFADKSFDLAESEQNLQRISDLATAGSGFQAALDAKRLELDQDPDIKGREQKFQQFAQAEFTKRRAGMDDKTGALFDRSGGQLADTMSMSVRHGAAKDLKDNAIVQLTNTNDDLVTKAGDARNPNERTAILDQVDASLKEAQAAGILTPAQYEQAKRNTLTKADQATALKLIRDNPGDTSTLLAKSDFLPNLDPVARQNLIDKAGNEVLRRANLAYTQAARADLAERRTMRIAGTDAMKNIMDLNEGGQLTENNIQTYRPVLDADQYKAARAMLRGGATTDDKDSLLTLETAVTDRDLKPELNNALAANRITLGTYRSLMSRNDAALKDDQPASPYKRGREQIIEGLKPGALLSGPAADIQKQALVGALREYDDMASRVGVQKLREQPGAALDGAQDIVNRYRIVNYDKIGEAVGLPRYVTANRETMSLDDLNLAGRKVLEELDAGRLSKDEAKTQLDKIELWDGILKQRDLARKALPKPAQGGGP